MTFGSEKKDIEILATVVGILTVLLIWTSIKFLGPYFKWGPQPMHGISQSIEEGLNFSRDDEIPAKKSNDYALSNDEILVKEPFKKSHIINDSRIFGHRSRVWLDTWQSKVHRPSAFSKSVMALILPPTDHLEDNINEVFLKESGVSISAVNGDCDKEMLVVPALMTVGMCDHNLSLGQFLWSPKSGPVSKGDNHRILSESTILEYCSPRRDSNYADDHCRVSNHVHGSSCCANHGSLSPLTAPPSEFVSALSSGKSSTSKSAIRKRQESAIENRAAPRYDSSMPKPYFNGQNSITSPTSSSSSSASALSPPPPSRASFSFLLPSVTGNKLDIEVSSNRLYPMRYKIQKQQYDVPSSPSHGMMNNNSSFSSPTTFEIISNKSSVTKTDNRNTVDKSVSNISNNPFNMKYDNDEINHFLNF